MSTVTIVICTRNRPQSLRRCLGALRGVVGDRDILVVDNASDSGETRAVAEAAGARVVEELVIGVNRARNTAAKHCTSDVLAYVDDDAIPVAGWLENLLKEFEDPRVMAVGGRIIPGDGVTVDSSPAALISAYDCGAERLVVDRDHDGWFERANFGGLGNGANMAFRRAAFHDGPVFDERIGYGTPVRGYGDHSGFFCVVERGGRAVYAPDAVVFHPINETYEQQLEKRARGLKAWGAYVTMLFFEYPRHRSLLLRYLRGARSGSGRTWRAEGASLGVPRWRATIAALSGALLYFRIRAPKNAARRL